MIPTIEMPKTIKVPKSESQDLLDKQKIQDHFRKLYLELFYKTFGKSEQKNSKIYELYRKFLSEAILSIPQDGTFEQIKDNPRALFRTDMFLKRSVEKLVSALPDLNNNILGIYEITNSLGTYFYDTTDPKLRDLSIRFSATRHMTAAEKEAAWTLPKDQKTLTTDICTVRINPAKLNEIMVDCDPNIIYSIGRLNQKEMTNFRSDLSIIIEDRRKIEIIVTVLRKIYPKLNESEILEMLRIKGVELINHKDRTEIRPWRIKYEPNDIEVLEELIENILKNTKKTASIGGFEFDLVSERKLREFSDLPKV